ncbi:MAG: DUF6067 family protein [Planctomycetota bacterium]|nr:DUF6067 family protein [Planctomycetota bacterium]
MAHGKDFVKLNMADYPGQDLYRASLLAQSPLAKGPIQLDRWKAATGLDGLGAGGLMDNRRARVLVGATATHLCVGVISELPPDGALVTDRVDLLDDDCLEIWLAPGEGQPLGIVLNSRERLEYRAMDGAPCPGAAGACQVIHALHEGMWHCQIEVPLEVFTAAGRAVDSLWRLDVVRRFQRPSARAGLAAPNGQLPRFQFVAAPQPVVQLNYLEDPGRAGSLGVALDLFNPTDKPLTLAAGIGLVRDRMEDIFNREDCTVPPGQTHRVLVYSEGLAAREFSAHSFVRDAAGKYIYSRVQTYRPHQLARWTQEEAAKAPLDLQFAYWPYHNRMRVLADVSGLPAAARLERVDVQVRSRADGKVIHSLSLPASRFEAGRCEAAFDLPALEGDYQVVATATGPGTPAEPVVKDFVRRVYPWEKLGLGASRKVYPPFEPIVSRGATQKLALKEYDLNDQGLLSQVRAGHVDYDEVCDLLAGPMRYVAVIDGKTVQASASPLEYLERADDRVLARGQVTLGPLALKPACTLEYDGVLRVDLGLGASGGRTVEQLVLEIPLNAAHAGLINAMSTRFRDAIKAHPLPAGEGVVWSAADLPPVGWPENFCTYVFLGDPNRGLCWFAENDAGWSWDGAKPNLDVTRKGGIVTLRVYLINKPLVVEAPRTITFGLQAAPVKPRLPGWRHRWYTENWNVVGCDQHWLGWGCCGSVHPPHGDLRLWEFFRRGNEEKLSDEAVEQAIAIGRVHFEPFGEGAVRGFEEAARLNLRDRYGKKMIFYYNRCSTAADEELQTFMDEWGMEDYNGHWRGVNQRYEIGVIPGESFIDYSLYWYGKSFDVAGNRGVYVDNVFFSSVRNRMASAAYRKADGSIMPSTGVWGLRDLAKRTFVYMGERGMEPMHMVHMTSVEALPLNSFYTIQYDWEWRRGEGDVHDRFDRDYLKLVTNGEHVGVWPVVLHELGPLSAEYWTLKTFEGVGIVHELIVDPYFWHGRPLNETDVADRKLYDTFRKPVHDLVARPGVQAYRYWDSRPQPVRASDADLPGIVYSLKGREAIFAITSYAPDDRQADIAIDPAGLGFPGPYRVTDVETGQPVPVTGNRMKVALARHDLKMFRLLPV